MNPAILFQQQEFKPVPLIENDDYAYMFALKQEFRSTFRKSPFHLKASEKKNDIERYSDRYQLSQQDLSENWTPGLETFLLSFGSSLTLNLPLYFCLENVVCFIIFCICSSSLQTRFFHGSKHEP